MHLGKCLENNDWESIRKDFKKYPVEGVDDAGAKFVSGLAALIGPETEEDAQKTIDGISDLAGYCYRFSLPSASLKHKSKEK